VSKRFSKEQLFVVGLTVGGFLLGLLGYVALVAPQKAEAKKLDAQLQEAHAQLVAAKRVPKVKGASVGAADLFRLNKAMPGSDDMAGILIQLSQLTKASDVKLVGLRPSPDVALVEGYSVLPIQLNVTGRYANITNFLHRLRSLVTVRHGRLDAKGRLFIANNLDISAADGRSVAATVTMNAFVYGGAAALSATAGPPSGAAAATPTTTAEEASG
jgi:Pilus assembly protein, PilO